MFGAQAGLLAGLIAAVADHGRSSRSWRRPTPRSPSGSSAASAASGSWRASRRGPSRRGSGSCSPGAPDQGTRRPGLPGGCRRPLAWWWGWPAPLRWKRLHPRWGLLALTLLTAPWYVAIGLVTRGRVPAVRRRARRSSSGSRRGWRSMAAFPGTTSSAQRCAFYPWSALVPAAVAGGLGSKRSDHQPGLPAGLGDRPLDLPRVRPDPKLIHYYLPAFPPAPCWWPGWWNAVAAEGTSLRGGRWAGWGWGCLAGSESPAPSG